MKVLVSMTSWKEAEKQWLLKVLELYKNEYADLDVTFALCVGYPFNVPSNSVLIEPQYEGWEFPWNNDRYVREHYQDFDYLIHSDCDTFVLRSAFDYYVNTHLWLKDNVDEPKKWIPGIVTTETFKGDEFLLLPRNEKVGRVVYLNGKQFLIPRNIQSSATIIDRERYAKAIERGLPDSPQDYERYTVPEMARMGFYFCFNKIVGVDELKKGIAVCRHLPNRYTFLHRPIVPSIPFHYHKVSTFSV